MPTKKNYLITLNGQGGRFCLGSLPSEKAKSYVQHFLEMGYEFELENYDEKGNLIFDFLDCNDIVQVCGPFIEDNTKINVKIVSSADFYDHNEIGDVLPQESLTDARVGLFITQDTDVFDTKISCDQHLFGGYRIESDVGLKAMLTLDENEIFDPSNLFMGSFYLDPSFQMDEMVATDVLYIPKRHQKEVVLSYLESIGDMESIEFAEEADLDDISDYLSEALSESYKSIELKKKILPFVLATSEISSLGVVEGYGVIVYGCHHTIEYRNESFLKIIFN